MTNEELLLVELCAKLPYGLICNDNRHGSGRVTYIDITPDDIEQKNSKVVVYYFDFDECGELENCKPYLRSMSSMTKEEREELHQEHIKDEQLFADCIKNHPEMRGLIIPHFAADWCDKNMFDYRGLIEKGLAIEVTEENNPYKD